MTETVKIVDGLVCEESTVLCNYIYKMLTYRKETHLPNNAEHNFTTAAFDWIKLGENTI